MNIGVRSFIATNTLMQDLTPEFAGAVASGGQCGPAALAQGFTSGVSPYLPDGYVAGTAAHAAVGGLAAKLAGGDARQGALTGAFAYLFNECAHGNCTTKLEQTMYDWWPGYKFGSCIYSSCQSGEWLVASGEVGLAIGTAGSAGEFKAAVSGLREVYKSSIDELGSFGMELLRTGGDPETIARAVVNMRNQIKDMARVYAAPLLKGYHRPTADQLFAEKKSWERVIEGARKSNQEWNKRFGASN